MAHNPLITWVTIPSYTDGSGPYYTSSSFSTWSGNVTASGYESLNYTFYNENDLTKNATVKGFFRPPFLILRSDNQVVSLNKAGIRNIDPIINIENISIYRGKSYEILYSIIDKEMIISFGAKVANDVFKNLAGIILKTTPEEIKIPVPNTSDRGATNYKKQIIKLQETLEILTNGNKEE